MLVVVLTVKLLTRLTAPICCRTVKLDDKVEAAICRIVRLEESFVENDLRIVKLDGSVLAAD